MSDEPRDGQPDDASDPAGHAADPATPTGPADDRSALPDTSAGSPTAPAGGAAPLEDTRTDGSRTDASAPWERPERWQRSSTDVGRVDAQDAVPGTSPADDSRSGPPPADEPRTSDHDEDDSGAEDPGGDDPGAEDPGSDDPDTDSTTEPDTRRSRRQNSDGEAVPAGALIAALGTPESAGEHEPEAAEPAPDHHETGGSGVGSSGVAAAGLVHGSARPRRHRGWLYAGRTVAALVAVTTLLGVGVEWKIKDRADTAIQSQAVTGALDPTDTRISAARTTAVVTTNSQGVKTTEAPKPKAVYQPENILLLGSDSRAGANAAIGGADGSTDVSQSDTLMVAHISGDRQHVTVLSIPRDTLVPAPTNCHSWDYKTDTYAKDIYPTNPGQIFHITNTYAIGGPQCIVSVVQSLTGLGITRMIGIDFKGFQSMVSALGGVTLNICRPLQDTVLGVVASKAGVQVVQGQQALNLVRARHVIGDAQSDLSRIHRQQVVLSAILRQVTQAGTLLNPGKLDGFLQAFAKNTFTQNVTLTDLVTLAGSLGTLDPAHVTFYTLPTVPSTRIDGALDVDTAKAAPVFDDLINDLPLPGEVPTPATPKPATTAPTPTSSNLTLTVAPSKVAVDLYNVSGRDNVGGMAQQELNAAGFSIGSDQLFTPSRTQTATLVQYDPSNRAAALTVAAAIPGSTLVVIPGLGSTVHLQLGSSFAGVVKTVAVGQQAPASLSTAVSTGASVTPSTSSSATASTALSSVNAGAGTCA